MALPASHTDIVKPICDFNWKRASASKDVYEMVRTISDVLSNYILHETVSFNDQDLQWINNKIKKLIQEKNEQK